VQAVQGCELRHYLAQASRALRPDSTRSAEKKQECACHATSLNRVQDIVQEHLGFAPGDVSLRDAALVQRTTALVRRAARLSACGVATVALQMGYVTGLGKDARAAAPSAERKPYSIGIGGRWVLSLVLVVEL
jgi:hexokinase